MKSASSGFDYTDYIDSKQWSLSTFGSHTQKHEHYFNAQLKDFGFGNVKDLNILEIGFGYGSFLSYASKNGANVYGIEINDELIDLASDHGYSSFKSIDSFRRYAHSRELSIDLIVGFDVLEHMHIDQIIDCLNQLYLICNSGTRLIFRVPSGDSPFSGPFFNGDLTHVTLLGSYALNHLVAPTPYYLSRVSNQVIALDRSSLAKYLLTLSRRLAINALSFAIETFIVCRKNLVVTPNMVFMLEPKV